MRDEHYDIFTDPVKSIGEAKGVLSKLFRTILVEREITPGVWSSLMARYLNDPYNRIPPNPKDRSSARGNLNKELHRPTMTWKVFRKAILFLAPVKATFIIRFEWPTNIPKHYEVSEHSIVLLSSAVGDEGPEAEEEKKQG